MSDIHDNGLPKYIGICGHPTSGKSLVQEMLNENYNVMPVDDGASLRRIAIDQFGATHAQVFTQAGKLMPALWPNGDPILDARTATPMSWRQVLGQIGNQLEELLGPYVMPMLACARLAREYTGTDYPHYSFGSVRKTQGAYFKAHGGVVIGIRNPLALPTGNAFDLFDESLVDLWIDNDALLTMSTLDARKDLEAKVDHAVERIRAVGRPH